MTTVKIKQSPDKILKHLEKLSALDIGEKDVQVGLPKGSNAYPDGTSVIMVGAVHEFGSELRNIPERSYLRSTIIGNRREYLKFIRGLAKKLISLDMTEEKALRLLGEKVKSDVQRKIVSLDDPPLARPREDGSDNPLNDTGHLKQSITYQVGDK